jgi:DNA repair exonuclease SbcCD ATPase subunit
MIPKRVELENFLSFGAPAAEIVFSDDEPLWVLGGPNGVGKSAVFDAMTYCLFGCHRGGKQDADQLVRHGANGFRVVFEFEFNDTDYRITRSRSGRTTQKVEQRNREGGRWEPVPGVNSAADVRGWAERTLGLGYDAFQASVLLRQGEADKIINAGPAERGAILRKIIGAERYRDLGERVHEAAKRCRTRLDDLRTRRDGLPDVTEAELKAAQDALEKADDERKAAGRRAADAAARVGAAEQWAKLDEKRQGYERLLLEADRRAADGQHIRDDKARLDELTAAVPTLRTAVGLRGKLAAAEADRGKLADERDRLTARHQELITAGGQARQKADAHTAKAGECAREARRLREEVEREGKFVAAADEVASLKGELSSFPPDLAGLLSVARETATAAADALDRAGRAKGEVEGLLRQAKKRQQDFASVGVGVNCSRCGQPVTEEHAKRERDAIAAEVRALEHRSREAAREEEAARGARTIAEAERDRLIEMHQKQTTAARLLEDKQQLLTGLGVTADADGLRDQLAAKADQARRHEGLVADETAAATAAAEEADRLDAERRTVEERQAELARESQKVETAIASDRGQRDTLVGQLPPEWRARLDALDAAAVAALDAERQRLAGSGVADRFRQLEQDAARREEWVRQRDELNRDIDSIPEASRVSKAVADRDAALARQAAEAAGRGWQTANDALAELTRKAKDRGELVEAVAAAERRADLHKKLDTLLGKDGLQRELIRSAEREIVRLADDTVRNLSDGDLAIELKEPSGEEDRALDLLVRRADAPAPTPVTYLSGSQKFRVAVAVALAIGRYAAGQARRLESVIIDEGFGSLDRDGLDAMANELNRLRRHLRRVVLVSHQEEFADRFPVVIKLAHGETGTTAEAVRR